MEGWSDLARSFGGPKRRNSIRTPTLAVRKDKTAFRDLKRDMAFTSF
jgi:hypothetical protein